MRPLIALLLVILVPGLAGANQSFYITSGSFVVTDDTFGNLNFTVAGGGFSAELTFGLLPYPFSETPFPPGGFCCYPIADSSEGEGHFSMTGININGVPWADASPSGLPYVAVAGAFFGWGPTASSIQGPGTYSGQFLFQGSYTGAPLAEYIANGQQCTNICRTLDLNGPGIVTFEVAPFSDDPSELVVTQATFTFKAPEPSTAPLLLLGFAGLAVRVARRRPGATVCAR